MGSADLKRMRAQLMGIDVAGNLLPVQAEKAFAAAPSIPSGLQVVKAPKLNAAAAQAPFKAVCRQ